MSSTSAFGTNYLGFWDFVVIAGTLLFSLSIGVFYAFCSRKQSNEELLSGGRKMSPVTVAASMLVSYLSAITIIGYPAEVYSYGTQIFMLTLVGCVVYPLAVYCFVPIMYKLKLTSSYKYLELRYDSVAVRMIGSLTFILRLLLISGIVLYSPALAVETMIGVPVWISLIAIAICGTIYTSIGGIKAVVLTDFFQFVMILVGMLSIVIKGFISAGGFFNGFRIANEHGRLELFSSNIDPFQRHNTLNIVIGVGFSTLCFVGTDQLVVQRYCALPTLRIAGKSILWSCIMGFVTVGLVVVTGVSIFASYVNCDPYTAGLISKTDQIVPYFVIKELAFIPGMMGLFVSVIFSAVLSTISSSLNSIAAVIWEDFLCRMTYFQKMGDTGQATTYKIISTTFGAVFVGLAFVAQNTGSIFQSAITVIGTTSGIQGSLFLMGAFMPFINKFGAIAGSVISLIVMGLITGKAILLQSVYDFNQKLSFSTDMCPADVVPILRNSTRLPVDEIPWADKIFTVSYVLYPIIGVLLTIFIASVVSICSLCCVKRRKVESIYLHPLLYSGKHGPLDTPVVTAKDQPSATNVFVQPRQIEENEGERINMGYIDDENNNISDEEQEDGETVQVTINGVTHTQRRSRPSLTSILPPPYSSVTIGSPN